MCHLAVAEMTQFHTRLASGGLTMARTTSKLALRAIQFSLAGAIAAGAAVLWTARPASASPNDGSVQLVANKTVTGTVMDGSAPAANVPVKLIAKSKTSGPVKR